MTSPPPQPSRELPALTGIRGIASWWVVSHHLWPTLILLLPFAAKLQPVTVAGDIGVDIFFVLSGFILTYTYADRFDKITARGYRTFLGFRLARIYPIYLFFLLVWLGFAVVNRSIHHLVIAPGFFSVSNFVQNLLLVQAWSIPFRTSWNYPAWSVSMEWLAYLCFPLLLALFRSQSRKAHLALLSILSVIAPITSSQPWAELSLISCEFTVGMLVYLILANAVTQQKPWGRSSSFIGLALLGTAIALRQINLPRQSALALIGLLIYSLSAGQGGLQAALASKAMVHLGRTSYSLYISHAAVISALHVALPTYSAQHKGLAARMAIALAYLLSLAITAELAYRFIEDPARRWLRSALRPEKALTMDKGTHRDLTAAVTIDRASP